MVFGRWGQFTRYYDSRLMQLENYYYFFFWWILQKVNLKGLWFNIRSTLKVWKLRLEHKALTTTQKINDTNKRYLITSSYMFLWTILVEKYFNEHCIIEILNQPSKNSKIHLSINVKSKTISRILMQTRKN